MRLMLARFLTLIRFSHTVFALPFAFGAMLVAAGGLPPLRVFLLIALAMVFARTAAMLFNRLADWEIDKRNPRTEGRHKLLPRPVAMTALGVSSAAFIATTWWINGLCFALSPVALVIVFFYSLTKRFTVWSHFFLGVALAVSPVGAWLAVTGELAVPPLLLAAGVMLWVAGFDLIYSTQDVEFDRAEGLRSMVVKLGVSRSLQLAQWLHVGTITCLAGFGVVSGLGMIYFIGVALMAAALVYEHRAARRLDVVGINRAFFWSNAWVGCVFILAIAVDLLVRPIDVS